MKEGIWRVYRNYVDEDGGFEQVLVAHFVLYGGTLTALSDHDGIIASLAPEGKVTARTLARLRAMSSSPYWQLICQDDIESGEYPHLLPDA